MQDGKECAAAGRGHQTRPSGIDLGSVGPNTYGPAVLGALRIELSVPSAGPKNFSTCRSRVGTRIESRVCNNWFKQNATFIDFLKIKQNDINRSNLCLNHNKNSQLFSFFCVTASKLHNKGSIFSIYTLHKNETSNFTLNRGQGCGNNLHLTCCMLLLSLLLSSHD